MKRRVAFLPGFKMEMVLARARRTLGSDISSSSTGIARANLEQHQQVDAELLRCGRKILESREQIVDRQYALLAESLQVACAFTAHGGAASSPFFALPGEKASV